MSLWRNARRLLVADGDYYVIDLLGPTTIYHHLVLLLEITGDTSLVRFFFRACRLSCYILYYSTKRTISGNLR